jgi:predicted TIM-barrel fold metal-dependent hydrolase
LPVARELADRFPQVAFVLDHCGNPLGGARPNLDRWQSDLRALGRCENVFCKVSGFFAGNAARVTVELLRPLLEFVVGVFGWGRVLWGSDWPVCNLGGSLRTWVDFTRTLFATESAEHRRSFFHANALRIYGLAPVQS